MNIGVDFYETHINIAMNIKNSKAILIQQFLYGLCKVLAIEPTSNSKDLGKWILIVHNDNYFHAISKLDKLTAYLYKEKLTFPTMISSFKQFHTYPEINGGMPVDNTMRAKVVALNLELTSQPVPPVVLYRSPNPGNSIWDHLQNSTTNTSVLNPATLTAQSYKSVVKNLMCIQ